MPAATFPEKSVVRIWQHYLPGRTDLVTEDGDGISIVYPGMINGDRGADLVDAVINKDNQILKGSIEVHVKSSSWWSHGHHEDPAYNDVVLHVVYQQDKKEAVNLQNGKTTARLYPHWSWENMLKKVLTCLPILKVLVYIVGIPVLIPEISIAGSSSGKSLTGPGSRDSSIKLPFSGKNWARPRKGRFFTKRLWSLWVTRKIKVRWWNCPGICLWKGCKREYLR